MSKRDGRRSVSRRPVAWWSADAPPWELWPGVSIRLEAVEGKGGRIESPCGRFYFDDAEATAAETFFPTFLRHYKGRHAGEPFELLPWQSDLVVRPLFGWKRVADGLRRFRKLFLFVPKKNGKSALASGLALYLLGFDGEPGAEVYSAAADENQARIVYGDASVMTKNSPHLMRVFEVLRTAIIMARTHSTYRALSSTDGTKHGFNVHGLIVDELHAHKSRKLFDTLHQGTAARLQPLTAIITTAGEEQESICGEEYDYAKSVRDGAFDDATVLPVVFEMQPEDDWTDPDTWRRTNPSLGHTVLEEFIADQVEQAKNEPRKLSTLLRLHLNRWTEGDEQWIDPEDWRACAAEFELEDLVGLPCAGGLDLSTTEDLTSFAMVFRRTDAEDQAPLDVDIGVDEDAELENDGEPAVRRLSINWSIDLVTWSWLPEDILRERVDRDRVPYDAWAREGWLKVTPGNVVDYDEILALVEREAPRFSPVSIGYDPWNAMQLALWLQKDGVPVVEVRQGMRSMSAATKLFGALVRAGRVRHRGSPLEAWCASNVQLRYDPNENCMPKKGKARRRIDPIVAAIIALSRLMVVEEKEPSIYETRGIFTL